jgi:hypothetical protein
MDEDIWLENALFPWLEDGSMEDECCHDPPEPVDEPLEDDFEDE